MYEAIEAETVSNDEKTSTLLTAGVVCLQYVTRSITISLSLFQLDGTNATVEKSAKLENFT